MPIANANGIRICYEELGRPTDPPVLLIMGLGSQMIYWRNDFCQLLIDRGLRVIRFDNRDVGQSTWFDEHGMPDILGIMQGVMSGQPVQAPYLLHDMAADAGGLLAALDIDSAHVVGASMGGMIAQTLAIEFPGRVRSLTSIMSTTGDRDLPPPRPDVMGVLLAPPPSDREGHIERTVNVFRTIGSPGFPFDEREVRAIGTEAFERGANPPGVARQLAAILASGSRSEALRALTIPALVIHGKDDPLVPFPCGERTAAAIPGARTLFIDGMGHDLPRPLWPRIVEGIGEVIEAA